MTYSVNTTKLSNSINAAFSIGTLMDSSITEPSPMTSEDVFSSVMRQFECDAVSGVSYVFWISYTSELNLITFERDGLAHPHTLTLSEIAAIREENAA